MDLLAFILTQLNRLLLVISVSYGLLNIDLTNDLIRSRYSRFDFFLIYLAYNFIRIVSSSIYTILVYPYFLDPLLYVPQAPQRPLLSRFFTDPTGPTHSTWVNTVPNQGLIRFYGRLNAPLYLPTTLSGCEEVLQVSARHFPKHPFVRKILNMWLGPSTVLSSSDGEGHKTLRKRFLPAFSARNIKELQPVFWMKANQMADALHRVVAYNNNNNRVLEVNLDDIIDRAALDVIGLAGHGVDFHTLDNPGGHLTQLHKDAFELGPQENAVRFSALVLPEWVFKNLPFKVYRDNRAGVKAFRSYTRAITEEELSSSSNNNNKENPTPRPTKSIVSMVSTISTTSIDDLVDLSMDLLMAGHKTVSSSLQLAFYTLAHYRDIQQCLREEVISVVPDFASSVSSSNSAKDVIAKLNVETSLPYLTAVQNELLRLFPPLPTMVRRTIAPATIAGYAMPDGSQVVVSQWAINRSVALWGPDANEFRPDRWLEEGMRPNLFVFSKGPRNCIGEVFARREVAILLARMVAEFEFEIVDEEKRARGKGAGVNVEEDLLQGITVRVRGGCKVGVRELNKRKV